MMNMSNKKVTTKDKPQDVEQKKEKVQQSVISEQPVPVPPVVPTQSTPVEPENKVIANDIVGSTMNDTSALNDNNVNNMF